MVRNILSQKVILLRRGFISKLLLIYEWPNSTDFTNFLDVLVPENQDYWMYQYPPADDVKLAKDTSKKRE